MKHRTYSIWDNPKKNIPELFDLMGEDYKKLKKKVMNKNV